ncbi:MAG TPA: outer membrane beta-barrel protein [Sediminibacterium sp.]|nr:outer membrane beta-barrel protein [Sediminibacterium sp.]
MLKKIVTMSSCALSVFLASAQTDTSKKSSTTISGHADTYYRYSFTDADGRTNNFTSFTNSQNSFELGMVSVRADYSSGKLSATADIGFGKRAQDFSYNDVGSLASIKQLYISYAVSDKLRLTTGKWATHIGYEVMDATGNRNYSMSYGFSFGPFFHTGLKADIALGGKSALMIGIADPSDNTGTASSTKYVLAQFSTAGRNDRLKAYLNFQSGGGVTQYNLVATAALSSKWSMAYDGSIQTTSFNGQKSSWKSHAAYLNFDPKTTLGFTLRQDYFDDRKINPLNIGSNIYATTLSANLRLHQLTLIPECRMDNSRESVFTKGNGSSAKSSFTLILAAVIKI